jgi:hypothetical protein
MEVLNGRDRAKNGDKILKPYAIEVASTVINVITDCIPYP